MCVLYLLGRDISVSFTYSTSISYYFKNGAGAGLSISVHIQHVLILFYFLFCIHRLRGLKAERPFVRLPSIVICSSMLQKEETNRFEIGIAPYDDDDGVDTHTHIAYRAGIDGLFDRRESMVL